ncbi:MAG TPA: Uma2 family endonuclease, partial [Gemmatimonadales bacterium]|nr:Uma2 family endonuclease [Gemmatimonadales bacterium]
ESVRRLIRPDRAWPRYETVHGELLVTPAPGPLHQEIVARLLETLRGYLQRNRVGHAFVSPADISWDPDSLVQPDVFVVDLDQARTMEWSQMTRLLLAIEVLSPSSARADRFTKRRLYQEAGVGLYWTVDPDARIAEAWTPEATRPEVVTERLQWRPEGAAEVFELPLAQLFEQIDS